MDKLYCFKYNGENCNITKIEIPEYRIDTNKYTGRKTYCFDKPRINKSDSHYQIPEGKLDRFVNDKIYTFNPDVENVKQIIYSTLEKKRDEAEYEYHRYQEELDIINERGFKYA